MIRHNNSGEVFTTPHYGNFGGFWGYLVLTHDKRILQFTSHFETVDLWDVTKDFTEVVEDYEPLH